MKRERDDYDIGLSLDADESPTTSMNAMKPSDIVSSSNSPTNLSSQDAEPEGISPETGEELKRNYDDALAARGLISVSRSSEKLTDLVLPAKMQRTLSQEFLRQQQNTQSSSQQFGSQGFTASHVTSNSSVYHPPSLSAHGGLQSQQFASQRPNVTQRQHQALSEGQKEQYSDQCSQHFSAQQNSLLPSSQSSSLSPVTSSHQGVANSSVEVPSTTKCSLCNGVTVDTQLRPCGHMFHGRCLRPSLHGTVPRCPIDGMVMQSAVLAVPTDLDKHTGTGPASRT